MSNSSFNREDQGIPSSDNTLEPVVLLNLKEFERPKDRKCFALKEIMSWSLDSWREEMVGATTYKELGTFLHLYGLPKP